MSQPRSVIVVGGGLAGIAASIALADRGVRVTLLETRQRLGGRATSFRDPQTGEDVDNCQHVAMGCCTEYIALCERLGVLDLLRWTSAQTWILPGDTGPRRWTIKPGRLPAPLHFLPSFAMAGFLPLASRASAAEVMRTIMFGRVGDWTGRTLGQFLDAHEVQSCARTRFFEPVVVSACNLTCDQVDAELAIKVFREGMMASANGAQIGVSTVPLVRLYDRAAEVISSTQGSRSPSLSHQDHQEPQAGRLCHQKSETEGYQQSSSKRAGQVCLGVGVVEVGPRSVRTADGQVLEADAVILATPPERAAGLLPASDSRREWLASTTHSPIVGVHLEFDRPVIDVPHAVVLDRVTQWVFRKDDAGTRVHAVISAADAIVDWPGDRIVEQVASEVIEALGSDARLVRGRAIKEKRATFAATPKWVAGRPGPLPDGCGPGEGVLLAGCYTNTHWPATMEGAVRSGNAAARAVLGTSLGPA